MIVWVPDPIPDDWGEQWDGGFGGFRFGPHPSWFGRCGQTALMSPPPGRAAQGGTGLGGMENVETRKQGPITVGTNTYSLHGQQQVLRPPPTSPPGE
jgi:hypothetical protein